MSSIEDLEPSLIPKLNLDGKPRRPEIGNTWLSIRSQTVEAVGGKYAKLKPQECMLLWLLMRVYPTSNISHGEYRSFVYEKAGDDALGDKSRDVHITNLRIKLGDIGSNLKILNTKGIGHYIVCTDTGK